MRSGSSASSLLAETASALGGAETAAVLYELLLPYGDRVAVAYPEISTGAVARNLGLLASTMERWERSRAALRHALAINARIGARPWLAHTQHDYARMLLSRDATSDTEKAQLLASTAVASYRDLGMHTYAESAATLTPYQLAHQRDDAGPRRWEHVDDGAPLRAGRATVRHVRRDEGSSHPNGRQKT